MAFSKKTWKDRTVQYPNRRKLTDVSTSQEQVVTVSRQEGTVTQAGDLFNATNMNDLENRIDIAISSLDTGLSQVNGKLKCDLLFGGGTTWETGDCALSHPYTDYDFLILVYSNTGESLANASSSYIFSSTWPCAMLSQIQSAGGYIATFGYGTRYRRYSIQASKLVQNKNGDSGTTGMIAVYGVKCS